MFDLEDEKSDRIEKELKRIIAAEVEELTDIQDDARLKLLPLINKKIKEQVKKKKQKGVKPQNRPALYEKIDISWDKGAILDGKTLDQRKAFIQQMSREGRPALDIEHFDKMLRRLLRNRRLENAARRNLSEDEFALWTLRRSLERENEMAQVLREAFVKPKPE
jgi:hypothetical protein